MRVTTHRSKIVDEFVDHFFCWTDKGIVVVEDDTAVLELVKFGVIVDQGLDVYAFGGRSHSIESAVFA